MKTSDLTGTILNWAVARAEGEQIVIRHSDVFYADSQFGPEGIYCPDHSWDQAGPIIERYGIRWNKDGDQYYAWIGGHEYVDPLHEGMMEGVPQIVWDAFQYGDTLLTAAMRCVVEKEFGDEIDIPVGMRN